MKSERQFCDHRNLYIKPSRDCRYCAWYECGDHPHHKDKAEVDAMLQKDKMAYGHPSRGTKRPWDGTKKNCRRHQKGGDKMCEACTLDRECGYRGEAGRARLKNKREEKKGKERGVKIMRQQIQYIKKHMSHCTVKDLAAFFQVSVNTMYRRLKSSKD